MRRFEPARQGAILCRVFLFAGLALAAGVAAAQGRGDPARGAARVKVCHACHGESGRAPLPMTPWLDGQLEEVTVLQLVLIREGLREVPQMAGLLDKLSDPDLFDIGAYYARLPPPRAPGAGDAARRQRGAALAKDMGCGSCHLGDYSGQKQVPRIANQREDYLAATLKAYRDNKRAGPDTSMNNAMYKVTDADIEALAHFLAHYSQ